MEKTLSVDEYDLLSFFEANPVQVDPGVAWAYNDSAYEVGDARVRLSFALTPATKDIRIILKVGDVPVYEVNAMSIEDIRYHNDKGREALEVMLSSRDRLWLRTKPEISLSQTISE